MAGNDKHVACMAMQRASRRRCRGLEPCAACSPYLPCCRLVPIGSLTIRIDGPSGFCCALTAAVYLAGVLHLGPAYATPKPLSLRAASACRVQADSVSQEGEAAALTATQDSNTQSHSQQGESKRQGCWVVVDRQTMSRLARTAYLSLSSTFLRPPAGLPRRAIVC